MRLSAMSGCLTCSERAGSTSLWVLARRLSPHTGQPLPQVRLSDAAFDLAVRLGEVKRAQLGELGGELDRQAKRLASASVHPWVRRPCAPPKNERTPRRGSPAPDPRQDRRPARPRRPNTPFHPPAGRAPLLTVL